MEIVVQILKHLPPGGPRILVLLVLGVLFFFPEMRQFLTKDRRDNKRLDLARQLLELRKLELTVVELKTKYPDAQNVDIDAQIEELLSEPQLESPEAEPLVWKDRFKFSLAGSFALMVMGTTALVYNGRLADGDSVKFILTELGMTLTCSFLASMIPCHSRWESVFRGFLIPALLGALAVAAKGNI